MDALKFFEEKERMCKFYKNKANESWESKCIKCPLSSVNNKTGEWCIAFVNNNYKEALGIVEKWSEEHSQTRQSEFLKLFPRAPLGENAVLRICPCDIESNAFIPCTYVNGIKNCELCKKQYWLGNFD